ncbi:MAG: glycerate kinase [Deltaproteobacteria bacterium]|nr:glycerate kinase [Deltaproteobacteria bacterium]
MSYVANELRHMARYIFDAAVRAADPYLAVTAALSRDGDELTLSRPGMVDISFSLNEFERIVIVGAGKAAAPMARAVEDILGDRISEGLICVKYGHAEPLRRTRIYEAGHPIPDQNGVAAAQHILELVGSLTAQDLLISLISGGGSALMPAPVEGVTLAELGEVTDLLLSSGAAIPEINSVRKHLSRIKGGKLAIKAFPAVVISLILSDVIGDHLDVIASGPFMPDATTFQDAYQVLVKYRLEERAPLSALDYLMKGLAGEVPETPKPGHRAFGRIYNQIVAGNLASLLAARDAAADLGLSVLILSSLIEGEARETAKILTAMAKEVLKSQNPVPPPVCLIMGGETTVTLRGPGLGGRCQEFALAAALALAEDKLPGQIVMLAGGTDGTDGPTDAAGAIVDHLTIKAAREMGLVPQDYLARNDSYYFFEKTGELLKTGPTKTNVMDIYLALVAASD